MDQYIHYKQFTLVVVTKEKNIIFFLLGTENDWIDFCLFYIIKLSNVGNDFLS